MSAPESFPARAIPATLVAGTGSAPAALARLVVAVPARDEADSIGAALRALDIAARQTRRPCEVVVLANNCRDETARVVRRHQGVTPVRLVECWLPSQVANAGLARRLAMDAALERAAHDGILVTSDADAELQPDALRSVVEAVGRGADLVCGTFSVELSLPEFRLPAFARADRLEAAYTALSHTAWHCMDQIAGRQAPGPTPHYTEAGACLAITTRLYRRIGGLPPVVSSEDRALVRAAEAAGAQITYDPGFRAEVSDRLIGRATGGLADMLRHRLNDPDPLVEQALNVVDDLRSEWSTALEGSRGRVRLDAPRRMRTSDLARELPGLRRFIDGTLLPQFHAWERGQA